MPVDVLLLDCAYILFVVIGALLFSALQCGITASYVYRLTKKVGPDYWGTIEGKPGDQLFEPTIALHPPAREMPSNYGRTK